MSLRYSDDNPEARFILAPPHILLDRDRILAAQEIDIRKPMEIFSPATSWLELLESSTTRGSQQLTQALQIYAPYLDPGTLELISGIADQRVPYCALEAFATTRTLTKT